MAKDKPVIVEETEDKPVVVEEDAPVVEEKQTVYKASDVEAGLDKMSIPEGVDPFKLICRDKNGLETSAAQIGQLGVVIARGMGLCFVPGGRVQTVGDQNCIA